MHACPAGTFNNYTKGSSLNESCEACPVGFYCQATASEAPTGRFLYTANSINVVFPKA